MIHGNQVDAVPKAYTRYLEKTYRRVLKLVGTPIRIEYKGGENPYEGKKNSLTARQVNKKRRLMSHQESREEEGTSAAECGVFVEARQVSLSGLFGRGCVARGTNWPSALTADSLSWRRMIARRLFVLRHRLAHIPLT